MGRAGLKDRQIILRAPVKGIDTSNAPNVTFPVDTFSVWASKLNGAASERIRAQREISIKDLIFETYYLADLTIEYQLEYDGVNYDIQSVEEVDRRRGTLIVARLAK